MNYQMLKSIVDSLLQNFKCPDCESGVTDKDIEIVGAAGKTINIDIGCPNCSKHTMVKAEISSMNVGNLPIGDKDAMEKLRTQLIERLSLLKGTNISNIYTDKKQDLNTYNKEEIISEKEITSLRKKLKEENINASDFFA